MSYSAYTYCPFSGVFCIGEERSDGECCPEDTWNYATLASVKGAGQILPYSHAYLRAMCSSMQKSDVVDDIVFKATGGSIVDTSSITVKFIERVKRALRNFEILYPNSAWRTREGCIKTDCGTYSCFEWGPVPGITVIASGPSKTLVVTESQDRKNAWSDVLFGLSRDSWEKKSSDLLYSNPYTSLSYEKNVLDPKTIVAFPSTNRIYTPINEKYSVIGSDLIPEGWFGQFLSLFAPIQAQGWYGATIKPKDSSQLLKKSPVSISATVTKKEVQKKKEFGPVKTRDVAVVQKSYAIYYVLAAIPVIGLGYYIYRRSHFAK